jgi:hypothetical protein
MTSRSDVVGYRRFGEPFSTWNENLKSVTQKFNLLYKLHSLNGDFVAEFDLRAMFSSRDLSRNETSGARGDYAVSFCLSVAADGGLNAKWSYLLVHIHCTNVNN